MVKIADDVREAASKLLDAIRDVPLWEGEPAEERQPWWHRINEGGVCDLPGCNVFPCYCDPDTDMAMQHRQRLAMLQCERAWQAYSRHSVELDAAAPEVSELLEDLGCRARTGRGPSIC
jgi:hypothetical protein